MGDDFSEIEEMQMREFAEDLLYLGWSKAHAHALCCYLINRGVISRIAWEHAEEAVMAAVVSAEAQLKRQYE